MQTDAFLRLFGQVDGFIQLCKHSVSIVSTLLNAVQNPWLRNQENYLDIGKTPSTLICDFLRLRENHDKLQMHDGSVSMYHDSNRPSTLNEGIQS